MQSYSNVVFEVAPQTPVHAYARADRPVPDMQQIWWLVSIGCRMSRFLAFHAGTALAVGPFEESLLFPDAEDENLSVLNAVRDFPGLQHAMRARMKEGLCLKSRYKFYVKKPDSAVRFARLCCHTPADTVHSSPASSRRTRSRTSGEQWSSSSSSSTIRAPCTSCSRTTPPSSPCRPPSTRLIPPATSGDSGIRRTSFASSLPVVSGLRPRSTAGQWRHQQMNSHPCSLHCIRFLGNNRIPRRA